MLTFLGLVFFYFLDVLPSQGGLVDTIGLDAKLAPEPGLVVLLGLVFLHFFNVVPANC